MRFAAILRRLFRRPVADWSWGLPGTIQYLPQNQGKAAAKEQFAPSETSRPVAPGTTTPAPEQVRSEPVQGVTARVQLQQADDDTGANADSRLGFPRVLAHETADLDSISVEVEVRDLAPTTQGGPAVDQSGRARVAPTLRDDLAYIPIVQSALNRGKVVLGFSQGRVLLESHHPFVKEFIRAADRMMRPGRRRLFQKSKV